MKTGLCFSAHFVKRGHCGAVTVEYAIIFPIVIICILILIYLGMLYYQQCLMQSVVTESARNLAFLWGYDPYEVDMKNGITSRNTYVDEELYRNVFSDTDKRKKKAAQTVQNELMLKSVIKPPDGFDVEVTYHSLLICKKIGISAKATYPLPFKGFFKLIGSSGYVLMETYSETAINDPREFIQNVDYLLQIYEESGTKARMEQKCKHLVDTLQKIRDYFR